MPGADPVEALGVVFGELPDLPHLPELPGRGPGADLTGRTAALLVDLPVETTPSGWRFAPRPGADLRRARGYLARDLDALEQVGAGYRGALKVQVCGPWTLAATIQLGADQNPALADAGAVRDLAVSLAEGVAAHAGEVTKRLPGVRLLLQIDEPALPAVLAGTVPTASGFGRVAAVDGLAAQETIRAVLDAAPGSFGIVHCCAPSVPLRLLGEAGARALSFDLGLLRHGAEDAVAQAAEAGLGLLAGVVPATPPQAYPERPRGGGVRQRGGTATGESAPEGSRTAGFNGSGWTGEPPPASDPSGADIQPVVAQVTGLWRRLGLPAPWCAERVVLTPACGLADAPPRYARDALGRCRRAARAVRAEIEG